MQLILPRPEPMQVQSQIIPSFGRSYVSPTRYDLALILSKHISSSKWTKTNKKKKNRTHFSIYTRSSVLEKWLQYLDKFTETKSNFNEFWFCVLHWNNKIFLLMNWSTILFKFAFVNIKANIKLRLLDQKFKLGITPVLYTKQYKSQRCA